MKRAIAVAMVLLVIGVVLTKGDDKLKAPTPALVGRYQLYMPGEMVGMAVLLDTTTGKTWHRVQYKDFVGDPDVWVPTAEKVDNDHELQIWVNKQVEKTSDKK